MEESQSASQHYTQQSPTFKHDRSHSTLSQIPIVEEISINTPHVELDK